MQLFVFQASSALDLVEIVNSYLLVEGHRKMPSVPFPLALIDIQLKTELFSGSKCGPRVSCAQLVISQLEMVSTPFGLYAL